MVTDNSTLKEVEERVNKVKSDYIAIINKLAKDKLQFSTLKNSQELVKLNRELCVCRCLIDDIYSPEKYRLIEEISKVDKAIFKSLRYPEPTSISIRIPD